MTNQITWPNVEPELLKTLPPALRGIVKALGFARARDFLSTHGGVLVSLPKHKSYALGLADDELMRLRIALANMLDSADRICLPKADKLFILVRDTQIRKERSKSTLSKLAKNYRLTSRHILNICREEDDRQFDLF